MFITGFYKKSIQKLSEINTFKPRENRRYLQHYWLDKGCKGNVLNPGACAMLSLLGGSLEIALTVPLGFKIFYFDFLHF